jgi:hypothetical protein
MAHVRLLLLLLLLVVLPLLLLLLQLLLVLLPLPQAHLAWVGDGAGALAAACRCVCCWLANLRDGRAFALSTELPACRRKQVQQKAAAHEDQERHSSGSGASEEYTCSCLAR